MGVSDALFAALMQSAAAAAKPHQWKGSLMDKWGQRTRVRLVKGHLENWSIGAGRWVAVVRMSAFERGAVPVSATGRAILAGADLDEACEAAWRTNHTGNHHRSHHVRVPKGGDGRARA